MGNSHAFFSHLIPHFDATIVTSDGQTFEISNFELIDHILLLRQVIAHQEMIQKGEVLDYYIEDYCKRMSDQTMMTIHQQLELPWQIDWIWHVHRLHPIAYNNDCIRQLSSGQLVDKRCLRLTIEQYQKHHLNVSSESIRGHLKFVPSLDLTSAILYQRTFLENFKKHYLFSMDLQHMNRNLFEQMVQNYVSFLKLSKENEIIVPTFDIDLIWHTHMRFPSHSQKASIALCGSILDHNDFI
ncbi:unnamed protein product [Rotaria sp. Silwood1]|nr:unnamed protein product [Rotaria sp. Silwood1]CAF4695351.1 unnamed protein product [Rotaria sp. Silwood1]